MNSDFKLSEQETMSWGFLKAIHPEERDRYLSQQQALAQGQPYEIAFRMLGSDGKYHWWLEQGTPVRLEDGTVQELIVTCTPQSEADHQSGLKKPSQKELMRTQPNGQQHWADESRFREQKLALHVQQTPLAVIEWNVNFEVIQWNRAAEKIFGYSNHEAIGRHAAGLIISETAKEFVNEVWNQLLQNKDGNRTINENITKDGKTIICEWYNTPLVADNGEVMGVVSLAQDITERKAAQKALKQSEQRVRLFVEHTPAAVAMLDREMRYILASRRWLTDYQLGEQEIIGRSHYEIFPENCDRQKEIHQRCLAGAVEKCEEDPFVRTDGEPMWLRWEIHPWHDSSGEIGGIIMFTEVITQKKAAQAEILRMNAELEQRVIERTQQLESANQLKDELLLREQLARVQAETAQQRFSELVNGLVDVIFWEGDPVTFEFSFVCQSAQKILGYPLERWITPGFWVEIIHPDDRARVVNFCQAQICQGRDYELEYRCIASDGRTVWLRDRTYIVRDQQGQIQKTRGLMIDITQSKQKEEELRESEARFRTMADTAPVLIWVAGTDTLCNWVNKPWLEFTGRTMEQELGNGWAELVHPEDFQHCLDIYITAFNARQPFQMDYRLRRADGEYRWLLNNGVPRFTPNGEFAGYIGSCIDITERRAIESALKARANELTYLTTVLAQTNTVLEKRNFELDQFAYVTSHDLKAPLRAIANLSEWIEEDLADVLTADTRHQMNLLRGRVNRMEALINGLLQYSRVGRLETPTSLVSVADLLAEVIDSLAPADTFTIEIAPDMPTFVTERLPLQQVFTNLISNAIKHHPRIDGKVKILLQNLESFYEFSVTDDGAGIASQYHEKVFGIFQTLEDRDKSENTGIGLAIVKKIVERQGGTIYLESQEGQGATFRFTWRSC